VFVLACAAPALAASKSKPKKATTTSKPVLARLTVRNPNVDVKGKKQRAFHTGASGQVLRQGDSLKTDASGGLAEISYTDGSFTRLGPNTEFEITKLTEKQGARQTQGTLTVGSTWNRAAKVSETGSFEITAGGATAAVEGTLFSVVCTQPVAGGPPSCSFVDLHDPISVTLNGQLVNLVSGTKVDLNAGQLNALQNLTREDLLGNVWIAGNLFLDGLLGFAQPDDVTAPSAAGNEGGGGGGGGGGAGGTGGVSGGGGGGAPPTVQVAPTIGSVSQYPPGGEIVVENPNVEAGGEVSFRGSGCLPGETVSVLFDHEQVGTLPVDAEGNFSGKITIPSDTPPGSHLLTVRGQNCELNAVINVLAGAHLAFTGSSNHTITYVLGALAAVLFGTVLVFATRRRRSIGARPARAP
jgi:FecR protein